MKHLYIILTACILLVVAACKKDSNSSNSPSGEKVTTTLSGRVLDESGAPISGAEVTAGGQTVTTNQWGIYVIEGVSLEKARAIITSSKSGFWTQTGSCHPSPNTVTYSNLTLFSSASTNSFSAGSGATFTLADGAAVVFPANAIAKSDGSVYTGNVSVTMHSLGTDAEHFGRKIPGSDLRAMNATNHEGVLQSFGMIGVTLQDAAGNKLNIMSGKSASITVPIAPAQQSSAPATIALWYFDDADGLWKEQGTATKNGNVYIGTVQHFTWWNCDVWGPLTYADGYVHDCNGVPVADAEVESYTGGHGETDANGYYYGGVGAGSNTIFSGYYDNWVTNAFYILQNQQINTLVNVINHVPVMIFSPAECPNFIDGTLVGCNGTSSQGTIVCLDSLNNFIGYQTTVNGSFHLSTPVGTFRLLAYEGTFGATSIAQVVTGQSCNVGNVPLCDSLNTGNNLQLNFTGIFGTMSSSFTVQACSVDSGSIPAVMSFIQYDPTTQRYLKVKLRMPSYANGTYSWNQSFLSLEGDMIASGTVYHLVGDQTTNGKTTMTSTPPFGGMMQGSFSGPITLTNNAGLSLSGSVQATFNIYRNH